MKLSTGKVAFPIEFDNGDKGVIYFNPQDSKIREKVKTFEKSLEERIKAINLDKYKSEFKGDIGIDIDNIEALLDMSVEDLSAIQKNVDIVEDIEAEFNNAVKAEIDEVFNSKISDVVFKYCEPMDIVVSEENGVETREPFIMHFMRWLAVEMKKYADKNKSAMDKHIAKYSR